MSVECPKGMRPIPAGSFKMGSNDGELWERLVREVELSPYAMKKHQVTVAEHKNYVVRGEGTGFEAVTNLFNKFKVLIETDARQRERGKQRAMLKKYLSRQKVADTSKIHKIFLREDVLDNPALLGDLYSPSVIAMIRHKKDDSMTFTEVKYVQHGKDKLPRSPIIVTIPASRMRLISGTQSERNTFDSMFYHEVEGHGTDHASGSEFSKLVTSVYQYYGGQKNRMAAAGPIFYQALEFSAFIKELDRLIIKFNFDQDPSVIEPWAKDILEGAVAQCAMTFLKLYDEASLDPDGADALKFLKLFTRFLKLRFNSVSARTRKYTAKLIARRGWHKPIPW